MAEEIDFENGRNSNFKELVTLTLTFDRAIRHTVVHHSSTSTYIPNFIQIEETFCGRTDVRTDGQTDISPLYIIRSTLGSRPNNYNITSLCQRETNDTTGYMAVKNVLFSRRTIKWRGTSSGWTMFFWATRSAMMCWWSSRTKHAKSHTHRLLVQL